VPIFTLKSVFDQQGCCALTFALAIGFLFTSDPLLSNFYVCSTTRLIKFLWQIHPYQFFTSHPPLSIFFTRLPVIKFLRQFDHSKNFYVRSTSNNFTSHPALSQFQIFTSELPLSNFYNRSTPINFLRQIQRHITLYVRSITNKFLRNIIIT